jgi:hypothetical protein
MYSNSMFIVYTCNDDDNDEKQQQK